MSQNDHVGESENPYALPMIPSLESAVAASGDLESRQLSALVGSKAHYYLNKWTPLLRGRSRSAGFNWAAFFLSGFWLPYRKMYKATVLLYLIIIVESIVEEVVFVGILGKPETPAALTRVVGLVASMICGTYGNRWYLSHACAVVSELSDTGLRDDALLQKLSNRGGTSLAASLGMFVLFLAVGITTFMILEPLLYGT
ncbi:MAG: DUF2628 domain-containing protein [Planctomycetota bacterium]